MMGKSIGRVLVAYILLMHGSLFAKKDEDPILKYVAEVVGAFSREMKREFGLIREGGGGSMPYDIEAISVKFRAYRRATIDEACALEVMATERLLKAINDHPKIRPYLREYPFTPPRAQVGISFYKLNGRPYTDGVVVGYVTQLRGFIFYRKLAENGSISHLGEEPYEAALRIVQNPHLKLRHNFSKQWSKHPEVVGEDLNEEEQRFVNRYYKQTSLQRWEQLKAIAENDARMTLSEGVGELIAGVGDVQFADTLQKIAEREKTEHSGEYVEYWDNGKIKMKGVFKNGWADGHVHGWYKSGCDAFKAYFNEGIKQGVHFAFFSIRTCSPGLNKQRVLRYNEKGKAHGEQQTMHPGTSTESYMTYINGVIHGEMKIKKDHYEGPLEERRYNYGKLVEHKVYPPERRPKKYEPLRATFEVSQ